MYIDTSVLVSALTEEVYSARTDKWFADQSGARFVTSDWGITEFSSALSIKVRMGRLTAEGRNKVLRVFAAITNSSFEVLPVSRENFRMAALFANRYELGLRGSDALHLAICDSHGVTICTLDQRMRDAATSLGIGAVMPA